MQVHVKRSVIGREDIISSQNGDSSHLVKPSKPLVRKSKLVVVDLAGSERIHKSGVYPTYDTFHSCSIFLFVYTKFICSCFSKWGMAFVCIRPSFISRLLGYTTGDFHPWIELDACAVNALNSTGTYISVLLVFRSYQVVWNDWNVNACTCKWCRSCSF